MELDLYKVASQKRNDVEFKNCESLTKQILMNLNLEERTVVRTSRVLVELQNRGIKIQDLANAVFAPRMIPAFRKVPKLVTLPAMHSRFMLPFLNSLRGTLTLSEVARKLKMKNLSTYHHWESGRRDIPFFQFLRAIDLLSGRLVPFVETLPFQISPKEFIPKPGLYHLFFKDPWTPTVFLMLRVPVMLNLRSIYQQATFLSQKLKITPAMVESSFDLLLKLRLARFDKGKLVSNPGQLYAIPSIPSEKIAEIHHFWFSRSLQLLETEGFHKVEQHAMTFESKEKIILWMSELREKIRKEVKKSGNPETVVHINWQLAEII